MHHDSFPRSHVDHYKHNLGYPQDAKVKHEITDPQKEPTPATQQRLPYNAIAYNPYSLDSLMAAAMMVYHPEYHNARLVPYNQFDHVEGLRGFDNVAFVGVEITQLDYSTLMSTSEVKLLLVSYRDSYSWLTDKLLRKNTQRVQLLYPSDEMISELLARTDNTAMKVIQFWLDAQQIVIGSGALLSIIPYAARMVSQSYPIMPFNIDLDEAQLDMEEEMTNKARVFDAVSKLRYVLGSAKVKEGLSDLEFKADVNAYLSYYRQVRYTLSRSMRLSTFRIPTGMLSHELVQLPVIPANEMTHGDILHAALQNYDEVITYEDVREFRVWRIYSDKTRQRHKLATIFKDSTFSWSEGAVYCVLTQSKPQ